MKKLIALLILGSLIFGCVSVNPATGNYPVTGDVLEAWISGIPYEFVDQRQYFRSLSDSPVKPDGLWIDVNKKGEWFVLYNVSDSSEPGAPPTPTAKFAPFSTIKYVERPFRK